MDILMLKDMCYKYYLFVYNDNKDKDIIKRKNSEELEEYLEEDFKFMAVNDYDSGYDIINFCDCNINNMIDFNTSCKIIKKIQTFYEENYGKDSIMDYNDISPEKVIRNYAYVLLYEMSMEELKYLLFENVYPQDIDENPNSRNILT
jgi:hypothetical protein